MGNLTRDPETRYTPKGTTVGEIGLAINRKYRVEDDMREEVTFVDITFWGKKAEVLAQYSKKGDPLFVEGRLHLDQWDDRETGKKRYQLKVIGDSFEFLGSGNNNNSGDSNNHHQSPRSSPPAPAPPKSQPSHSLPSLPNADDSDDGIPF